MFLADILEHLICSSFFDSSPVYNYKKSQKDALKLVLNSL